MNTPFTDKVAYDSQSSNPMFPNGKWVVNKEDACKIESALNSILDEIHCPEAYDSKEEHYEAIKKQAKEIKL